MTRDLHIDLQYLLNNKFINFEEACLAQTEYEENNRSINEIILELNIFDANTLTAINSEEHQCYRVNLDKICVSFEVMSLIPNSVARKLGILPIIKNKSSIYVVFKNINNIKAIDYVKKHLASYKIIFCTADEQAINKLFLNTKTNQENFSHLLQKIFTQNDVNNVALKGLINFVFEESVKMRVSDIHFEPYEKYVNIRYRIDGVLTLFHVFHRSYWVVISNYIKLLSKLDIIESKISQDGHFCHKIFFQEIDFRVSIYPVIYGENIVIRILDKNEKILSFDNLGYNLLTIEKFKRQVTTHQGMCVISGPTGSGKTTLLRAMINSLKRKQLNIMTLENPVEYTIPHVRQTDINSASMTFAGALRAIMRQNPDVIMLGEIRDMETAQLAINASMTGHKIYTTVHAYNILGIFDRLISLGMELNLVVNYIKYFVSQRLVRKLCHFCKVSVTYRGSHPLLEGKVIGDILGCAFCNYTGYYGRTVIYELLILNEDLISLIKKSGLCVLSSVKPRYCVSFQSTALEKILLKEILFEDVREFL